MAGVGVSTGQANAKQCSKTNGMIRENKMVVCVTLTAPLLGGLPFSDIARTYVGEKVLKENKKDRPGLDSRVAEELALAAQAAEKSKLEALAAGLDAEETRGSTGFARDDMGLFVYDYWLRGYIKEALQTVIECEAAPEGFNQWNRKTKVDQLIFVEPRRIYLRKPAAERNASSASIWTEAPGFNTRPIRTEDPRTGASRTAIARSEEVPAGTWFVAELVYLTPDEEPKAKASGKKKPVVSKELLTDIFNYGKRKGLGQWRSGGWGTFEWVEMPDNKLVIPASHFVTAVAAERAAFAASPIGKAASVA